MDFKEIAQYLIYVNDVIPQFREFISKLNEWNKFALKALLWLCFRNMNT